MKKIDVVISIVIAVIQSFAVPAINAFSFCFFWNLLAKEMLNLPIADFKVIWMCLVIARLFMIFKARVEID